MVASTFRSFLGFRKRIVQEPELPPGTTLFLHGKAEFLIEVSRASRHQDALREIVGGRPRTGHRHVCIAALLLDDRAAGELNAVSVEISGRLVGYLPSYLAVQYREWLQAWHLVVFRSRCRAMIVNANCGEGSAARYYVKLDLELPFKMTTNWL